MRQHHTMVKHIQAIRRLLPTNFLSVFDHFVRLTLKELEVLTTNTISERNFSTLI